jgi:hypothetical protein
MSDRRGRTPIGYRNGLPVYEPKHASKTRALRGSERELKAAQELVALRSRGACERCKLSVAVQFHHRLPRGAGGSAKNPLINVPSNLLHVCLTCHALFESEREEAYLSGWLVHRGHNPADVPVTLGAAPFTHRFLLLDDGTMIVAEEAA